MRRGGFTGAMFLALVMVSPAQSAGPAAGNPAQARQSDAVGRDEALWRRHCGPCHLEGGTGTFMLGRRLGTERALLEQRTDLNAQYVRAVVRNGIQSMPRFSRAELPDADLERIVQFLMRPKN